METLMFDGSENQRYNRIMSCSSNHSFISRPPPPAAHSDQEFFMLQKMGMLQPQPPPPFLSHSHRYNNSFPVQQQLPPLLPLPTATPRHAMTITRGQSCPPVNKLRTTYSDNKTNKSLTPKKTKSHTKTPNKNIHNGNNHSTKLITASSTPPPTRENGLSRDMKNTLAAMHRSINASRSTMSINALKAQEDHVDMVLSSGVFTISPPPSSLPLPSFSLRPKLSCNSQAAAVDTSTATDSLRRYLQLR